MKYFFAHSISFILLSFISIAQAPTTWSAVGIGGGGALFSPSINPDNPQEYYLACDMGELYHSTNSGVEWKLLPFQQIRGSHYAKVNFTSNPSIRYCINYRSGLSDVVRPSKTTDGGQTWNILAGNPDSTEMMYALYANYDNPNQVLINQYNAIYFSNDGGTTFALKYTGLNTGAGCKLSGVFWDGNSIYCGTNDGILRSIDGGNTFSIWSTNGIANGEGIASFSGAKENGQTRFYILTAATNDLYNGDMWDYYQYGRKVYKMDNLSASWTDISANYTYTTMYAKFIRTAVNDIDSVYIAGQYSNGTPMVLRSTGANWQDVFLTNMNQNIYTSYCGAGGDFGWTWPELLFGMDVCPKNASQLLISDYGFVHKSTDGGNTWYQCYSNPADQHIPNIATPVHQLYQSAGDINEVSVWQVNWMNSNNIWASHSDIKGIRSVDGGTKWSFNYNGHTENTSYRTVFDSVNNKLYMATSSVHDVYQSARLANAQLDAANNTGSIKFSLDKGNNWQIMHDFSNIVCWVAMDPNDRNTLYASVVNSTDGNGGIWVTHTASSGSTSTWTKLANPPRTTGHPYNIIVLNDGNVVVSYSGHRNPNFVASSGVFLYDKNTSTWSDRSDIGMQYWTQDVVIDPYDATQNTWYACVYNGWGIAAANGVGGLYKSNNRGQTWTRIYVNPRCMSVTISPTNPNEMYMTTEYDGLLYCSNLTNANPVFSSTNYPFRNVIRTFFNPYKNNELWVCGFGGGMMRGGTNSTAIHEVKKMNELVLFPNPTKDKIYFKTDLQSEFFDVRIYSISGAMMYEKTIRVSDPISILTLIPGLYLIEIKDKNNVRTQQFTKYE